MKYTPRIYAKALTESFIGAPSSAHESIIKFFIDAVRRRGDARRMPEIIEAVREIERKKNGGKFIEVTFARHHKKQTLDAFRTLFTKHDDVVFRTEPELTAGVRITVDGEREFDNSASRRIKKLFR